MALARPVLAAVAALLLLVLPSTAPAAPCWQGVIADASDGRIDREYPIACYRKALESLPEDVRVYGTAGSDIQRALMSAVSRSVAPVEGRTASVSAGSTGGTVARWLAIAGGIGAIVGLVALVSLHTVRARRRH
jgi:hypothetical protein